MKTGRWAAIGGLIGAAAFVLAACGSTTASTSSTQALLQKQNTMVTALPVGVGITDFAPIANASAYSIYNSQVEYMMWAPLVMVSGQDTIDWADSIAKSITPSNNDQTFTVSLKNWNWSNGKPITAQDVAFTANLVLQACTVTNPPYSYGGCGFGGIPQISGHPQLKSVAVSGNDVVFTTSAPANPTWFELNALGQIQPMPQSVWDKGSVTQDLTFLKSVYNQPTAAAYKVISGPYKFDSFVNNQYWKFSPNASYGGPKATINVTMQYEASDQAEFAALKTQKINAGYLTATLYGSANQLTKNYVLTKSQGFCWYGVMINSAKDTLDVGPAFQDPKVRQALEYGIDQNAIGKVLDGTLNGQNMWIPNYSAIPSGFPNLTQAVFGTSSIPNPYPFSIAKGKALLEAAGYKLVNGVMTKGSIKLSFPVNIDASSTETQNAALILQQDWKQMGVDIQINPMAFDSMIALSDAQPGTSSKWAVNWSGGWCYEPNFYPTGGGMWQYYDSEDNFNLAGAFTHFNSAVQQSYAPGTAAQAQQNMLAYANATATDLPQLWMPGGYTVDETAPYIHGTTKWFNPVQAFTQWNHLTISH